MERFTEIIDDYILNYDSFEKGKISFDCYYGELIFNKKKDNMLILYAIYIFPKYRKNGLCSSILHYLIDKAEEYKFKYFVIQDVLSNILYEYLLRFSYKSKTFKNTKHGFIYKIG
jgi:hypothetical protein